MYFKSNNKISAILVFSLVFSLLFSNSFVLINAQTQNKTPIKIGVTVWVPNFLAYVAQEKGIFKKNNVDVNLTLLQGYNDAINKYANGDLNGIFTVYSDAIIQHSTGVNTKVVYNVDSSFKADAIVGKGNSLLDVKGKNISVDGINSFSHLFVLKSLEKVGLNEGDLEFVNVPVQNVSEELQKGKVFAGHTYEPFVSDAIKKGFKILSTGADVPGIITNVLAFHSDIVQQRPQDIQNIVKSMIEAKADYDKNKEQDISIMSLKSGLSKDQIIEGINNVKLLDLNYNIQNSMNKTSTNTTSLYVSGKDIAKFYAERGVISEYPNIDDLVDSQFVSVLFKENNIKLQN
jgi:NitT/TauT family transport system substrate-binding protein